MQIFKVVLFKCKLLEVFSMFTYMLSSLFYVPFQYFCRLWYCENSEPVSNAIDFIKFFYLGCVCGSLYP